MLKSPTLGVLTPTIGTKYLENNIISVKKYKKNIIEKRKDIFKQYDPLKYNSVLEKALKTIGLETIRLKNNLKK